MSLFTDTCVAAMLDHLTGQATWTAPSALYMALFTTMPANDGTGGTEVSGGNYTRQRVYFDATTSRQIVNSQQVMFTATGGDWVSIVGTGLYGALTNGTLYVKSPISVRVGPFVAEFNNERFTSYGHGMLNNQPVVLTGDQLPTGVLADTIYYIRDADADTFRLALVAGGAAINLTTSGGGYINRVTPRNIYDTESLTLDVGKLTYKMV